MTFQAKSKDVTDGKKGKAERQASLGVNTEKPDTKDEAVKAAARFVNSSS